MSARQEFQTFLVKDPSEFDRIPGYSPVVNPIKDPFKDVLAHHHFNRLAKCSIKQCGQNYLDGYLVIWTSGVISNIGHCCAGRFVDKRLWNERLNKYRETVAIPQLRAEVITRKLQVESLIRRFVSLRASLNPQIARIRRLEERFPAIHERISSPIGDTLPVEEHREMRVPILGDDDKPTGKYRTEYKTAVVGYVRGISCVQNRGPVLTENELTAFAEKLERSDLGLLSFGALSKLKSQYDAMESQVHHLAQWGAAAARLFSEDSVTAIGKLRTSQTVEREAKGFSLVALDSSGAPSNPRSPPRWRLRIYRGE